MNTQRFGLPVVIAAGLHGALFLCMPETTVGDVEPPTTITEIRLDRMPDELFNAEPEPSQDAEAGAPNAGARPLPSIPEVVQPLTGNEPFTVPVEVHKPVLDPVDTLTEHRGGPPGPGFEPGKFGAPGILDSSRLDKAPRAMVQPAPAYPDGLRRDGIDGTVTVAFIVDTEGRVVKAQVMHSTHREFEEPAVRAVLRWRFEPGRQNGRKVSFRMAVPIEFNTAR